MSSLSEMMIFLIFVWLWDYCAEYDIKNSIWILYYTSQKEINLIDLFENSIASKNNPVNSLYLYNFYLYSFLIPGISTYGSSLDGVMMYITPLLDLASSYVPVSQHSQTPLYIMATAGMRLLSMR